MLRPQRRIIVWLRHFYEPEFDISLKENSICVWSLAISQRAINCFLYCRRNVVCPCILIDLCWLSWFSKETLEVFHATQAESLQLMDSPNHHHFRLFHPRSSRACSESSASWATGSQQGPRTYSRTTTWSHPAQLGHANLNIVSSCSFECLGLRLHTVRILHWYNFLVVIQVVQ